MKPTLVVTLLLVLAGTACTSSHLRAGKAVTPPQEFTLQPGEHASLPQQGSLHYIGVENDSRCPPQVQCIWAGDAQVRLRFEQAGAQADVTLQSTDATSQPLGPWTLQLLKLEHGAAPAVTLRVDDPQANAR